jgi:hypothetical protein
VGDGTVLSNVATASIAVNAVHYAPVAVDDAASVDEDATTGNLRDALLANDADADAGDTKTIAAVDTTGTLGTVLFDAATGELRYRADADAFDALEPGETATDSFFYTVRDSAGETSTARVTMTISGVPDDGEMLLIDGGNGKDNIFGSAAAERILAGNGKDVVHAGAGNDSISGGEGKDELFGEDGNDTLEGGTGHDLLSGGAGDDVFVFRKGEAGGDRVLDFEAAGGAENDTLVLDGYGPGATLSNVGNDYTVSFAGGMEKFWLNATSLDAGDVLFT